MEGDADEALPERLLAADVHLDRAGTEVTAFDPSHAVSRRLGQPHAVAIVEPGRRAIDDAQLLRGVAKPIHHGLARRTAGDGQESYERSEYTIHVD
jgi:hypothetical protein